MSLPRDQPDYSLSLKPFWYDRNPAPIQGNWVGTVGPHAVTDRTTYTVPPARKFFLENAQAVLIRMTAAAPVGLAGVNVLARGQYLIGAILLLNTVGDKDSMNVGRSVIMTAGEIVKISSFDLSTGGTIRYQSTFHGIEFDE